MKKIDNYFGVLILFIVLALSCTFYKLLFPEIMLDTFGVIFDQYNSSGAVWSFWKGIGLVTRVFALVTISASLIAIVCELRQFVKARLLFTVSLLLNFIHAFWLFFLMIAEKNELVRIFLIKIFSTINGTEYSSASNLFQNELDYVSSKSVVLYIIVVLLLLCIPWIRKREKTEKGSIHASQIAVYTLEVGLLHLFFNYCTESRLLFKIFGVEENQWDVLNDSIIGKNAFGFFFYIPVILIVTISLTLFLYDKISKYKLLLINGGLLLANFLYVVIRVYDQINKHEIAALSEKEVFFSLTAQKVALSECIGLLIFEFVTIFALVQFLQKKCSLFQLILYPICIFVLSLLIMVAFHKIEWIGLVIGLVSLVLSAFYVLNLYYRKKITIG